MIAREWAYHGTTLGALAVTGVPRLRQPFLPMLWDGVRHVTNTLNATTREQGVGRAQAIEEAILEEGPETVSMVIAEPVQNGRGALVPPEGYWQELRRICDQYGVLLCADEVICGYGRLGAWFGSELFDVVPDLLTFAKGVTSAYVPLGGVIIRPKVIEEIAASPLGSFVHGVHLRRPSGRHGGRRREPHRHARRERDRERRRSSGASGGQGAEASSMPTTSSRRPGASGYFYAFELAASRAERARAHRGSVGRPSRR